MKQVWLQRFYRWNMKAQQMLRGRYARFDQLSKALLIVSLVLLVVNMFVGSLVLRLAALALLVVIYYRFFSKKIYPRANENTKYLALQQKLTKKWRLNKEKIVHRKEYRYFTCPNCQQSLRAPRGKGSIKVTCSACHEQFIKKV